MPVKHLLSTFLVILVCTGFGCKSSITSYTDSTDWKEIAPRPPMGWNSFDAYDCRINETEFKAIVDYIAEHLKPYGYEYVVLDYIWWHPEPGNWDTPRRKGHPNIRYTAEGALMYPEYTNMDEYGRLLPAVERFPSSAGGAGLNPLPIMYIAKA